MSLTNADLSELAAIASEGYEEGSTKAKALRRVSRAALMWPVEAAIVASSGGSLTELRAVGPWTSRILTEWLEQPPEIPPRAEIRSGFLTYADVRAALEAHPERTLRADFQMHTTYSDGNAPLDVMVSSCVSYEVIAITDHSKGLKIANGMDEDRLAEQGHRIDEINAAGRAPRVLKAIEMNLSPTGDGDMDADALAALDLVLGAFHSKLRTTEDQTDRYLAALRNPTIDVLAHPRGRVYNRRTGLYADWDRVFAAAAEEGVALEIDCYPDRQDLSVDLLQVALEHDVTFSIGTDAHSVEELAFIEFGVAIAAFAGVPPERILNNGARTRRGRYPSAS